MLCIDLTVGLYDLSNDNIITRVKMDKQFDFLLNIVKKYTIIKYIWQEKGGSRNLSKRGGWGYISLENYMFILGLNVCSHKIKETLE